MPYGLRRDKEGRSQRSEVGGQRADSKRRGDAEIRGHGDAALFSWQGAVGSIKTAGSFRKF